VQPDRRLAGSRPALDDQRAGRPLRDQPVLLGRDGGDDLPHLPHALAGDVLDDRLGEVLLAAGRQLLVDEPEHRAVLDVQPPPARDAPRRARGRGVERLGGRRAPVDGEQLVVRVGHRVAADVQRLAVRAVDPPEVERPARGRVQAQALQAHRLEHRLREDVALPVAPGDRQRGHERVVGRVRQV
jgi:hypothetical protein